MNIHQQATITEVIRYLLQSFRVYVPYTSVDLSEVIAEQVKMEVKNILFQPRNDATTLMDISNDLETYFELKKK
jgi:hypothetical protein